MKPKLSHQIWLDGGYQKPLEIGESRFRVQGQGKAGSDIVFSKSDMDVLTNIILEKREV